MPETDTKTEESREYTKTALMRMTKPDLIAVAGEIGVDLGILPKITKGAISDAIMVFLEPHLDYEAVGADSVEPAVVVSDEEIELEELIESEAIPMPKEIEVVPEPPPTIMQGTYQDILRPHTNEKSVRVRRIEESSK